ncbi:MAG: toxin TcdB middle/N-terminal domain-containing protein [Candidatus Omnitrophota bacterium]|nr:toxin TcdB middle/N-terminal domain-containing protein [Candidatus Omnitrophota bacterium]
MNMINFSYDGKILRAVWSKAISIFLCITIITFQLDTARAEAATTTPPPSSVYQGNGTDADPSNSQSHGPVQAQSSSSGGEKLTAMAATSDSGTGGAQTQTSFSSLTGPLGTTKQIFQTDLFTGRASAGIPIVVSPGRGNIQPEVALSYTSGGGNSWCGVGWDLSIGSIERSTRKGVPAYNDSSDVFVATFSGVQSDLVSIGSGEYRAKYDPSYLKFKYDGTSWTVWDKNGTKYAFGSSAGSRVTNSLGTFKWCLDRVTNIDTNFMTISYTKDSGEIYLDTILYTGNDTAGDLPRQSVKFNLEASARPDTYENYRSCSKVTTQYRLSNIEVKCDNVLVRKYQLQYSMSPNTYKSLLSSIVQYGSDNVSTLPPPTFTYQSGVNGWTADDTWIIPDGSFVSGNADQGRCLVDLNGDALPDFMVAIAAQGGSWYERSYKSTGSGWVYDPGWNAPNGNFIWVTQGKNIDDGRRLADVNGDGFPDWIVANKYWTGGGDYSYGTYLNGKTYWNTYSSSQWNVPDGFFAYIGADQGRRFADVNGDGLSDFLVAKDGTRVTYLNNGSGWTRTDSWNVPDGDFTQGSQLMDLNGDGLADLVIAKDGTKAVYMNSGKGWTRDDIWNIPDGNLYESSKPCGRVLTDINGDGLPDLVIAQDGYRSTYINTGHGWQKNDAWNITDGEIITSGQDQGRRFSDVNGDGMEDLVIANGSYKKTYLNASPVPDLLRSISNGVGGSTSIAYTPSTKYYNNGLDSICDLPIILQTVSSVTSDDGMGHAYTVTYKYWDGVFDVPNREFLGFDQVRETDADGNYVDNWFKQDPRYKGRMYLQETKDRSGSIYSRLWNYWDCFEPYAGVYLPYLKSQDRYIYDGDSNNFKRTQTAYEYDSYGNPIKISYSGDDTAGWGTILGDEKYTYIDYVYNQDKWVLSKASHTYTTDSNGNKVSEGWRYYDNNSSWYSVTPVFGRLTKEEKWSNSTSNAVATFVYDTTYGNATSVADAKGRTTTTIYDSIYHMYPELVTNALGQTQSATYDPKTGQILTSTDPNGQISKRVYDVFGRAKQAFGPYDDSSHPSAWYEYDLSVIPVKLAAYAREENNTDDPDKIRATYTFSDGIGRTVEVKSDAQDPAKQIVSNIVVYNNRGLTDSKFFSYLITPGADRAKYIAPDFIQPKASFQYDPVGRVIKTINPDNTYSTTTYARLVTTFTDENGHQKRSTKDVYGRVLKIEEFNGASIYTTTYAYNTLDNLTTTVDTMGNTAAIQYDSLGRKISMNDPDMGSWSYIYDEVGNLKSQTDAKNQTIAFTYDSLNRLIKKTYPLGTPVSYTYDAYPVGSPSGPYTIGRLTSVADVSGMTLFYYDRLGREIKTVKTVDGVSYTTLRSYDAPGRLISVTSPDGEAITYAYNRQGGIDRVAGSRTYVNNISYSATGQMLSLTYGNGAVTNYQYDPNTLRLTHLTTQNSQSTKLQDLGYTFDNIGNVKTLTDASPTGTNTQSFEYDDLYRLTKSTGAGYGVINYQYDPIGNMTQKGDLTLTYPNAGSVRPHAVKTAVKNGQTIYTPDYDANGNMIQKGSQVLQYDYENRLAQVGSSQTSGPVQAQIALNPGMNMISLPIVPADTTVLGAFSSISFGTDYTQVSRYNAVTKNFEHWVNNPKFDQFNTLDYGIGYQIYVNNPNGCTLTITGNYPSQASNIALTSGYNLIGAPITTSKSVIESLSNLQFGVDYDKVARYNPATQTFEYFYNNASIDNFTTMDKGYAYYIHVLKDATWQIPLVFQGTTTFVYDGDGGRVKKISPDGTQSIYVGSGYEVTKNPDNSTSTIKSIFLGENRICETVSGSVYYFHQDHIGSSNVITNDAGQQVACYEYKPYGETSKVSGSFSTDIRFTGQRLDNSTGFYYYGARYYDPELGRFIQPDTIVQAPFDPQSLNRYTYCRNNPINYIDPTGHSWLSKFWDWLTGSIGNIVGAIVGAAVAIVSGNLWLGFQAYSMTSSVINSAVSGNWGGLAGGIVGGLIGGALGVGAASGIYGALGKGAFTFGGGFLGGAAEFGLSGFGSGFGYALGSGEKVGDALQSGLISGGISAAIGGAIQGSYNAGWQNSIHGMSRGAVGKSAGLERKVSLELTVKPISKPITMVTGGGIAGDHWGLRVKDNYNEFNGTWDFGANLSAVDKAVVGFGGSVMASAESAVGRGWTDAIPIQSSLKYATAVYGNIQENLGRHEYRLDSYTCQTWVNNRLNLRNDNFTN